MSVIPLSNIAIVSYMSHDKTNLLQTVVDNILISDHFGAEDKMNDAIYAYFVNNPNENFYDLEKLFREKNINTYFVAKENPYPTQCKLVDCRDNIDNTITHYVMIIVGRKDHYEYHINKYFNGDENKNSEKLKFAGNLKAIDPIYDIPQIKHLKRNMLASGDMKINVKVWEENEYNKLIDYFYQEIFMDYGCIPSLIECANTSIGKLFGLQANGKIIKMSFAFSHPNEGPIKIFSVADLMV
jgi:hypothetical protein